MKLFSVFLLAGLFLFSHNASSNDETNRICIVGFERRDFPVSLGLKKIFKDRRHVDLFLEAGPRELENCLREDYDEIILVTHAILADGDENRVSLGYFQELKGVERREFIDANINLVKVSISDLETSIYDRYTIKKQWDLKRLRKLLKRIEETPDNFPLYSSPQILFSRYFEHLSTIVESKFATGDLKLKKFRLMTCARDLILQKYPFFNGLVDLGVELDVAPASRVASFFKGRQVTNFNGPWIMKSLK